MARILREEQRSATRVVLPLRDARASLRRKRFGVGAALDLGLPVDCRALPTSNFPKNPKDLRDSLSGGTAGTGFGVETTALLSLARPAISR